MTRPIANKLLVIFSILIIMTLALSAQAFAWVINADFEAGQVGSRAQGTSGFTFAGTQTTFSSDRAFSGTKSAKIVWSPGSDGWGISHGEFSHPQALKNGEEIWIRGYYYFASPWSWNGTFNKVLRLHVFNSGGANEGYHSIITNGSGDILASNEPADLLPDSGLNLDKDRWQCLEMYVKFSTSDPIVRMWKDGVLAYENRSNVVMRNSTDYIWRSLVMTHWNNGAPQSQTQYVDDFQVTNVKPTNVDIKGNPMIGLTNGTPTTNIVAPNAPSGLTIITSK